MAFWPRRLESKWKPVALQGHPCSCGESSGTLDSKHKDSPMHVHAHDQDARSQRGLKLGAAVTLAYVLVALGAGLAAHSLALLSEAGQNFTDFVALLLSWVAVYLQSKPPNPSKTWGYHRAGVLAAFVNVLTLGVITV